MLSDPRALFGIHSVSPYNRTTGAFYGILRVLASSSLNFSGELIELKGGSSKYSWAVEDGAINGEMSLKPKEYPDFLFELFLGKAPTATGAAASGTISTPANKNGTSIVGATGITAACVVIPTTGAANLKFGRYVLKATGAAALNVYVSTNADFQRGTDEDYDSDLLLVATCTVATGANTDLATLGLRLVGGGSATAFTTGDTATFEVMAPTTKSMDVVIGANGNTFPEWGAIIMGQRRGNAELMEVEIYRAKGVGLPLGFDENKWSESEIKAKVFYDSAANAVFRVRHASQTD